MDRIIQGICPSFFLYPLGASALFAWSKVGFTPLLPRAHLRGLNIVKQLSTEVLSLAISIPVQVLICRAIVTPYRLPYTRPFVAFKLLRSATERRQPSRLYLLPGLAVSQLCLSPIPIVIAPFINLLFWSLRDATLAMGLGTVKYFFFALARTTVQTPLELIAIRLALQRKREGEGDDVSEAEVAATAGVKVYSIEEVIKYVWVFSFLYKIFFFLSIADTFFRRVRNEKYPYLGFVDCFNKIVAEEGWETLFKGWWFGFLTFYVFSLDV
ncbi:hypothetical protein L218DRAFT_698482 [Marasmius fiardii PR-910]|nr:hypothetical protein L218DRAFT_698482 [Marasmius fiardii PR-910]